MMRRLQPNFRPCQYDDAPPQTSCEMLCNRKWHGHLARVSKEHLHARQNEIEIHRAVYFQFGNYRKFVGQGWADEADDREGRSGPEICAGGKTGLGIAV